MQTADQEWNRLAADLAPCLGDLDEDEVLIISYKRANYFVQFAAQGAFGVRVEAVSNAFIEPVTAALTVEQYDAMKELGWLGATNPAPQEHGEEEPADGSPNFFMDLAKPVDFSSVANFTTRTLREVYGVRHPGELQYRAFSEDAEIRFPTLRIKRAEG